VERRLGRNAKPARTHQQLFRVIDDPSRKIYDSPSRARLYGDPSRRVTNVYDAPIWQRYIRYCSTRHACTHDTKLSRRALRVYPLTKIISGRRFLEGEGDL